VGRALLSVLEDLALIQDALTMAAAFALAGGLVAARHERRGGRQPATWIVARWTAVGAALGVAIHLLVEVA
jgi:hypothetical protein